MKRLLASPFANWAALFGTNFRPSRGRPPMSWTSDSVAWRVETSVLASATNVAPTLTSRRAPRTICSLTTPYP